MSTKHHKVTEYEFRLLREAVNSLMSLSEGLDDESLNLEAVKADRALKRIVARRSHEHQRSV